VCSHQPGFLPNRWRAAATLHASTRGIPEVHSLRESFVLFQILFELLGTWLHPRHLRLLAPTDSRTTTANQTSSQSRSTTIPHRLAFIDLGEGFHRRNPPAFSDSVSGESALLRRKSDQASAPLNQLHLPAPARLGHRYFLSANRPPPPAQGMLNGRLLDAVAAPCKEPSRPP
jgi:hypothetical protein